MPTGFLQHYVQIADGQPRFQTQISKSNAVGGGGPKRKGRRGSGRRFEREGWMGSRVAVSSGRKRLVNYYKTGGGFMPSLLYLFRSISSWLLLKSPSENQALPSTSRTPPPTQLCRSPAPLSRLCLPAVLYDKPRSDIPHHVLPDHNEPGGRRQYVYPGESKRQHFAASVHRVPHCHANQSRPHQQPNSHNRAIHRAGAGSSAHPSDSANCGCRPEPDPGGCATAYL